MKVAINFLVIVALMMTSLAVIAQDTAEPEVPVVNEDSGDEAEILTKDADQLLLELLQQLQKQDLRDPFSPDAAINNEQRKGPVIAPNPNIICIPAPAATNFSLEI